VLERDASAPTHERKQRCERRERRRRLLGFFPRRKHLRDTWIHRVLGERLFAHELWKPERRAVAGGLALGVFIALTPTLGVQMALAALLAIALRVNLPVAIAACWLTNPATAGVVYALLYRLGLALSGPLAAPEIDGATGPLHAVLIRARPLWVGCLVAGTFAAGLVYATVMVAWRWIAVPVEPLRHHGSAARRAQRTVDVQTTPVATARDAAEEGRPRAGEPAPAGGPPTPPVATG